MRRFKKIAAIIMALVTLLPATTASASASISVTIDGNPIIFQGQQPVSIDGRTLVPARGVFEALGFDVRWDGDLRQVVLTNDLNVVIMNIGSTQFTNNGITHQLDVPAQIINGSTMVPLRAPLESVGYQLDWTASTQTVIITRPASSPSSAEPQLETTTQEQPISEEPQPEPITQEQPISNESSISGRDLSIYEIIELGGYTACDISFSLRNLINRGHDFYRALDIKERLAFIEMNRVRAENGLHALVWNYELAAAARSHSRDMLENNFLSHTGSDGSRSWHRAYHYGYRGRIGSTGYPMVSEIAGTSSSSFPAQSVVRGWYNSPGHRRSMLSEMTRQVGIGLWYNPETLQGGRRTAKLGGM